MLPLYILHHLSYLVVEKKEDFYRKIMLVVDLASKYKKYSNDEKVFMWAALLHDIGKLTA